MGQRIVIHDFQSALAFSERASEEPFWDAVYRKAFPTLVNHMPASGDTASQRMGIDRIIVLASGQTLNVDEKKRRGEWKDILLEYISVDTTDTPGWIEKDLAIDYLAYAFMLSRRVYLFPWLMLRRAWNEFGAVWIATYSRVEAQNKGYRTISVAVPIEIVRQKVSLASVIQLP